MEQINILWPDAELERVSADYDAVVIELQESTGSQGQVRCGGYIGYRRTGMWDEIVVENAIVSADGEYLANCVSALMANAAAGSDSGNSERNTREWKQLEIRFIDRSCLTVVATRFDVVRL